MSEIKELLKPLKIGTMTLKNRVFMAPMMIGYESEDGSISPNAARYWAERAKGGVGCIITEMMSADPNMSYSVGDHSTMNFGDSRILDSYKAFTDEIHSYGAKIIPQISIPGPEAVGVEGGPPAPSSYNNAYGVKTRALDKKELPAIVRSYANMAKQARELGFDGIQLHAGHAYMMLGSFLSSLRNKRTDEYGGSLLNRARLLIETLTAIKKEAGKDFPIIIRMSGDERVPGGNTVDDLLFLAPYLIEAGADGFEVSGGAFYEVPDLNVPCMGVPQGFNTPHSAALKAAVNVPVTVVGRIVDPRYAEYVIASGKADAVVVGRALISDPHWVNKAGRGEFDDIVPCTGCGSGCIQEFFAGRKATCVINPAAGREEEFELIPAPEKKKVVVVGGGLAGMAAAITAARRGHEVTLMEKDAELGGQMKLACKPPFKQTLSLWTVYYNQQIDRLGVKVKTGINADAQSIAAENPDSVIIATGASSIKPPIPGVDAENVYQAWDVIANNTPIIAGNVVIIGGGSVGLETAELLINQARGPLHVTIVEMLDDAGVDLFMINKMPMMRRLLGAGVTIQTNMKVTAIQPGKVCCENKGRTVCFEDVTHVVLACGSKSDNMLYESIRREFPEAVLVGDAQKPGKALQAVEGGTRAGMSI